MVCAAGLPNRHVLAFVRHLSIGLLCSGRNWRFVSAGTMVSQFEQAIMDTAGLVVSCGMDHALPVYVSSWCARGDESRQRSGNGTLVIADRSERVVDSGLFRIEADQAGYVRFDRPLAVGCGDDLCAFAS